MTPEEAALEARCWTFAKDQIVPHVDTLEADISARLALFQEMAKLGLFSLCIPREYGGRGVSPIGYLAGLKAVAKADAGIAVAMAVTNMVAEAIVAYGTDVQKECYLPKIGSGACIPLSFALTETEAGSDVKSIKSSFTEDPQDSRYLYLSGEKKFITNADIAGAIVVFAKGTWGGSEKGVSAFLIDRQTPGCIIVKKENKLGLLTANLVAIRFENCRISKDCLLGTPGQGLQIALRCLDSGRIGIGAQAVGIAEAAFDSALSFSKNRSQFGCPIFKHQAIAFKLVDMHTKLNAATWMIYRAGWLKGKGRPYTLEAAEAKLFASEACNEIVSEAMQIHGGYGYIKDYPVEKYFRDARVTTIYEGTSEIQRLVISRHLLQ